MQSQPSERVTLAGIASPQTINSTPVLSSAVDMGIFEEAMFVLCLGDMASETIDFRLDDSPTSGGSYTAITGKAATQLAAHSSNNDNKQIAINLKGSELNAGARFVKGRAVTGGTVGGTGLILCLGMKPRIGPASDDKISSLVQNVT